MANLIVRNIDESIVKALKKRASTHGVSAEAEHRKILEQVLLQPKRKSFAEVLKQITRTPSPKCHRQTNCRHCTHL
jgi:plasmid stability protein